jgi:hypothetical protein
MHKTIRIVLITLLVFTGLNALVAGFLFMLEPSGAGLGMTTDYLQHSPFTSYFIPGLVLFTAVGLVSLFAAYSVLTRKGYARKLTIFEGILLCGWIVVQMLLVRDVNALHVIMFSIGFGFILLSATKPARSESR